jgi:hypothetical protein
MMKVIQTTAEIGADRTLHVPLPADVPEGTIEVLVVLGQPQKPMDEEARRAAAVAGLGALKDSGLSIDEFLAERREEERRREDALKPTAEEARRAAIRAATGSLRDVLPPTQELLSERRDDDRRRDTALGL